MATNLRNRHGTEPRFSPSPSLNHLNSLEIEALHSSLPFASPGDARRAAFDEAFDFGQCSHAGVAGGGHGQRAVSHAAADGPVDGLAGEQPVDQPGGKAVAAAPAVQYVDLPLRDVDDLILVERDCAPGVAAGRVRGAQRAGDELQVGVCGGDLAEHLVVTGDGQLGEVLADAFDFDAEHGGEIFFVA